MPITLYNEAGDEVETLSTEEIEALKQPQALVTELLQELGADKPEDLKEKIKELKESEHPNFPQIRQQVKTLNKIIEQLKKEGKTFNTEGQIIEDNKGISKDELVAEAQKTARQELINEKIEDTLEAYQEDERKVIMHYFNKISAGENLTLRSVDKFISDAVRAAGVGNSSNKDSVKQSINRIGSSASNPGGGEKNFADSEAGKSLLGMMGIPTIKKEDKK